MSLGDATRPVVIQFVQPEGEETSRDARQMKSELEQYLSDALGLTVKVQFVGEREALKTLCNQTPEGYPGAAWVSAFTFAAARQACGAVPVLAVKRGRSPLFSVGTTTEIIARAGIGDIAGLSGQVFCRLDAQDFTSWVLPSLILASQGVDPLTDLAGVQSFPDNLAMLRAVYEGTCAAAALPPGEFEDLLGDLADEVSTNEQPVSVSDVRNALTVLVPAGDTTLPANEAGWMGYGAGVVPYEVLAFPPDTILPAALRFDLTDSLVEFFEDRTSGSDRLDDLLDASGLIRTGPAAPDEADPGYFATFLDLIARAGWGMAAAD